MSKKTDKPFGFIRRDRDRKHQSHCSGIALKTEEPDTQSGSSKEIKLLRAIWKEIKETRAKMADLRTEVDKINSTMGLMKTKLPPLKTTSGQTQLAIDGIEEKLATLNLK